MTYASLQQQILAYLNRTDADLTAQIPNFIAQAQERICRESKSLGLETYITGNFLVGNPTLPKPGRWRRSLTFSYIIPDDFDPEIAAPGRVQMFLRTYDYIRLFWPNDTQVALPQYYGDYSYDYLLIGPTPSFPLAFEYAYLELPEPLSVVNQTNWLTNFAPDVILYASLLEATPYLKNDERIPVWEMYYNRGISTLNSQDDLRVLDRASDRKAD